MKFGLQDQISVLELKGNHHPYRNHTWNIGVKSAQKSVVTMLVAANMQFIVYNGIQLHSCSLKFKTDVTSYLANYSHGNQY